MKNNKTFKLARNLIDERELDDENLDNAYGELIELVEADPNKPIVVYCRSGRRSAAAKEILLQAGHNRVTNLGGLTDWPATQ